MLTVLYRYNVQRHGPIAGSLRVLIKISGCEAAKEETAGLGVVRLDSKFATTHALCSIS